MEKKCFVCSDIHGFLNEWVESLNKSDLFHGLIGLDACTVLTKVVNVLVLEEEEL